MLFTTDHRNQLSKLLNSEHLPDALNFRECHGFLSGLATGPIKSNETLRIEQIAGEGAKFDANFEQKAFSDLVELLFLSIQETLFQGDPIFLPCTLEIEEEESDEQEPSDSFLCHESLEEWAYGFLEAYVLDEALWYKKDEDASAEMLLPILVSISELENETFDLIRTDADVFQNLVEQIPSALTDLYLFHHSD